ncbi:hypothetical protein R0381_000494 [Jeongeupia wiesaeckerbachi]|uniref:hypothetical protein n=1 Tax=Jeongeupia wiesaeckerbachi TaxID=3051218 RepID=UPI003D809B12
MNNDDFDQELAGEEAEEYADRQRKDEPAPALSPEEFAAWRSPREGSSNPMPLDNPLWHWLVRTRWDAYNANEIYAGPSSLGAGPMWCFQRFGKSETGLPDGRVVHIGGEHEDYYDPDFYIYNDVTVVGPSGHIAIHGYPVSVFPPTDSHSATLVDGAVFIIGGLGYAERRVGGVTPVYKLLLDSMQIDPMETHGEPPGWIYKHTATLADDGLSIIVSGGKCWVGDDLIGSENIDSWSLDTLTGKWSRLTEHRWQRWVMRRVDCKRSRLWAARQALWHSEHAHLGLERDWTFDDEPDFAALKMLYRMEDDGEAPITELDFNCYAVVIDGLTIRFKEEGFWIEAIVEGRLDDDRLESLQRRTLSLLERIEASACEIVGAG